MYVCAARPQVCGKAGHQAGFVGSTYVDCPNKPCYLCKVSADFSNDQYSTWMIPLPTAEEQEEHHIECLRVFIRGQSPIGTTAEERGSNVADPV